MLPRCFFAILALVLVATVTIRAEEEVAVEETVDVAVSEDDVEARNPLLVIAVRVLAQAFKWATRRCLEEAANRCKGDWKHPKALVKCAGSYLKQNKGRCLAHG